ncbi:MAG TPA: hypothetical protein VMS56_11985, partial [Thermoanaerobaculia bacterium]|nr:hypothetical protein [Thermoanaerobaculia bacterium]
MFASRILGCSLSLVLVALTSTARELHVIGVFAPGARLNACLSLRWESDVLFYNSGSTTEQVRLLNVSNGEIAVGRTTTMEVPPGRVVSLRRTTGQFWFPRDPPTSVSLWMWRLEVPETVEVTSFMELRTIFCPFPENKPDRGQITLPTFDRLVPAGQEQLFLGTDLG